MQGEGSRACLAERRRLPRGSPFPPAPGTHPCLGDHHAVLSARDSARSHAGCGGREANGFTPVWAQGLPGEGAGGPWRLQGGVGWSEGTLLGQAVWCG